MVRVGAVVGALAYLGHGLFAPLPNIWAEGVLVSAVTWLAAASVLLAGRSGYLDLIAARCLGFGLLSWAVGNFAAASDMVRGNGYDPPEVADAFMLAFGLLASVAVWRTLAGNLTANRSARLDGAIVAFGFVTICLAAVVREPPLPGEQAAHAVAATYALVDLCLLAFVLASAASRGTPLTASQRALACGLVLFTVGDVLFYLGVERGDVQPSVWSFTGWILGVLLIGQAPWLPGRRRRPEVARGLGVPFTVAVAVTVLLALDSPYPQTLLRGAEIAATATLALVLLRLLLTLRAEQYAASKDRLTGLDNRERFLALTDLDLAHVRQDGGTLALLLVDLRGFKEINDTFGHASGDLLLGEVATRLQTSVPAGVRLARIGSDEFALSAVLPEGSNAETAARDLARTAQQSLDEPLAVGPSRIQLRASVGVALAPAVASSRTELLRHADVAMYRAKEDEIGLAVFDPAVDVVDTDRLALAADLAAAIRDRDLLVHYQPVVDARTLDYVGSEALVRWNHPRLGLLMPASFVSLAHRIGATHELTLQVLNLALEGKRVLRDDGSGGHVAVNIDANDLLDPSLPDFLAQALERLDLSGDALRLEITEEVFVARPELALSAMSRFAALGVDVAIDDFGTGYSSLSYLQHLPVQFLKIDRSFVSRLDDPDAAQAARARAVAGSIVGVAHQLGMRCVAEGVEQPEHLRVLRLLGCDLLQGYLVGPAMPLADLREWRRFGPDLLRRELGGGRRTPPGHFGVAG